MNAQTTSELGMARSAAIAGFTLKEFAQPAHRRLPWHVHDAASICYVVSGAYAERARGQERECPSRSMVFKPAAERHADVFGPAGGTCLLIEIGSARLDSLAPFADITATPALVQTATLAALGHRIYREFVSGDAFSPLAIEGLILEVLAEASRAHLEESSSRQPKWLRHALELLHEAPGEPLALSSIARAVGIHPSHLARTFRAYHHMSIGDYLRRLRIERAAREIVETSYSLAEVSVRSGFVDQSHFTRVFKRQVGLTPAAFRTAARDRR